jgi:Family of unknown function (DUF6510)
VEHLDGNAIAGQLMELFGAEMTAAVGHCRHCGTGHMVGELVVYTRGPGIVVRCPSCHGLVIVLVTIRGTTCVDIEYFDLAEMPATPPV